MSGASEPTADPAVRCPLCRGAVSLNSTAAQCASCSAQFPATSSGQIDFRLSSPRRVTVEVEIGGEPPTLPPVELGSNAAPEIDLTGFDLPGTISRRFATWLPAASRPGARALDLGCGDTRARALVEHAGYEYTGIDFETPEGDYLADAHALPFADGTFDLVITTAVIEYLRQPYVAMEEVHRVLASEGWFCGNVGFLVPYLPVTYFHHTHMGILSTLDHAGFTVHRLLADQRWTAIEATTQMAYFPRMPKAPRVALMFVYKTLHRMWWALGARFGGRQLTEAERQLRVSGDVEFVAQRA